MIFGCSHGKEDPERAILPFIAGNVAAVAGQGAYVLLTIEGVWNATNGYADDVRFEGMPELRPLFEEFVDNGGIVWACGACTKPRGITEDDLVKGAVMVGAAKVVEEVANDAQHVAFA